ncbi:PilZ domain-containing protein [Rhizobium sp. TH2]|uniref:PilZ domain-containing protein n=1 Tax=Rhizobium sp. TH2 TaxID=2775403 RepID=UPI0021578803|nr:PilZ domain-containing protein [Rhizobium sp. TH2]UVC09030.1 PilZ domain-containing protein [Rhizobium sp. TH2]
MMNAHNSIVLEDEQRHFRRRQVRLDAMLSCMRSGLRGYISQSAMVLNLSEGGCMVSCASTDGLTNDLHIVIAGLPAKIGCTVVGRTAVRLNLQFTEMLPPHEIDRLAARRF